MKVGMMSLGCPKNRIASEQMLKKLADAGFELSLIHISEPTRP